MDERKKSVVKSLIVGAVIAVAVGVLGFSREYGIFRCISDGAFVAATALIGVGGIKWVVGRGAFDVSGYGMSSFLRTHLPSVFGGRETRDEYLERKAKERKPVFPQLIAGAVFLVISVVFMIIYYI